VKDNDDGTYAVEFTPSILGRCRIELSVSDQAIPGSPFQIEIGPGPTSAQHSAVNLEGLRDVFAGCECQFFIIPKDAFYNEQPYMEGNVKLKRKA
jgi:hypothetical protein